MNRLSENNFAHKPEYAGVRIGPIPKPIPGTDGFDLEQQLYFPDPIANGQWWHYSASVKDSSGHRYGVQLTIFGFHGQQFVHCAITNEAAGTFFYQEKKLSEVQVIFNRNGHYLSFECRGVAVRLHGGRCEPRDYGVDTSIHYGYPRMVCNGLIGGRSVTGVMSMDRETFNKLMLPNETGWEWMVLWLDDGRTLLQYVMHDEDGKTTRLRVEDLDASKLLTIAPVIPDQHWPANDRRAFGYGEALCEVAYDGVHGMGYLERVGVDGKVDL